MIKKQHEILEMIKARKQYVAELVLEEGTNDVECEYLVGDFRDLNWVRRLTNDMYTLVHNLGLIRLNWASYRSEQGKIVKYLEQCNPDKVGKIEQWFRSGLNGVYGDDGLTSLERDYFDRLVHWGEEGNFLLTAGVTSWMIVSAPQFFESVFFIHNAFVNAWATAEQDGMLDIHVYRWLQDFALGLNKTIKSILNDLKRLYPKYSLIYKHIKEVEEKTY